MPKGPPVSDGPANGVVAATTTTSGVSEEHTQLQLSAAVSDFLSGGDTNAGLRALRDLPPEHRRRFIKVVLAATLCKGLRNALLMRDVIYPAATNKFCSSQCLVSVFSAVVEVLDVVGLLL